jgi:hypothetical protein
MLPWMKMRVIMSGMFVLIAELQNKYESAVTIPIVGKWLGVGCQHSPCMFI